MIDDKIDDVPAYRKWLLGVAWRMFRQRNWIETWAALAEIALPGRSVRKLNAKLKNSRHNQEPDHGA